MSVIKDIYDRGMLSNLTPGIIQYEENNKLKGYVGFDPTSDSLHIGNLIPIMLLRHFMIKGYSCVVLIGGATGCIGDPSGKSEERNLISIESVVNNAVKIKDQIYRLLSNSYNCDKLLSFYNNYEWFKDMNFIQFSRDIGKYITVNYMMSKDSVKNRITRNESQTINNGISFTEFTYQLIQGYDFLHLFRSYGVNVQMGGADQWGNMTTGIELIRRIQKENAYAFTCPLITRNDGSKFGKTANGENIWLDLSKTSAYKFYQFWLNQSDEDAEKYIKIYSMLNLNDINHIIYEHKKNRGARLLQKKLAEDITTFVHGTNELKKALICTDILFSEHTKSKIKEMDENMILEIFEGVERSICNRYVLNNSNLLEFLFNNTSLFSSKSDIKRSLQNNSVYINKEKINVDTVINYNMLLNDKYMIIQKGKKNYHLIIFE